MADSVRPTGRRFVVGWQRNTSWVMALAVCLTVAGPPAGSPAAAALPVVEKAAAAEAAPKEAADEATAMWLAYKHGSEVEILSKRTESSQTFAMPQGSLKLRQSATPQRVRRGAGWVPVRPRLRHLGGAVVPEATTLDVRFAADKSSPLITLVDGDRRVSLSWPYPLPSPTLSDDTATYPEVFPGVDLKLSAGADSVSEVLVVKTREAAQDPETATKLARLRFGLKVNGLRMEQDSDGGFIRAVDPAGKPVFMSDGARMWDSPAPAPPAGSRSRAAADAEPQRIEDIPVRLSTDALTVLPSLPMLTDPKTTFPLFIDPGSTAVRKSGRTSTS